MPQHGPPGDRHGLLGFLDRISEIRENVGTRVREGVEATGRQIASVPGLLDRAMIHIGDNPLDFLPGTGEAMALQDARQSLNEGRPGMGLLALAGAVPGVPGGIFKGLEALAGTGLRVFARTGQEFAVPSRRVIVVTPNTKPGEGVFRASILEETREGIRVRGHVDGPSEKELVEVIEGKVRTGDLAERAERAGIVGLPEIPVGSEARMEFIVERNAERGLMDLARQDIASGKSPTGIMRKLAEGRELPGGVGGFFNP